MIQSLSGSAPATVDASLVVVTCRSRPHIETCVESFRRELSTAGLRGEIIIVEHSEDYTESEALDGCRPDRLIVQANRGYAAGINRGAEDSGGAVLLLANPDVEFLPGSLTALLSCVEDGNSIAGPQLTWDIGGEVFLPPPEDFSASGQIRQNLRSRSAYVRRLTRASRLEMSWRQWSAHRPIEVPFLRGPLLAVPRSVWNRQGGLPEDYFLYYEETEWLMRAKRSGVRLVLAGNAKVVHRWGHATRNRADRAQIEARSMRLFVKRNYSRATAAVLHLLSRIPPIAEKPTDVVEGPEDLPSIAAEMWLLAPEAGFQPAIGCLGAHLPDAVVELTGGDRWHALAAARRHGRWEGLGAWHWVGRSKA